jgi:hypothetical protein
MKISNDQIERLAVSELSQIINANSYLQAAIPTGDKAPIWDGEVRIYKKPNWFSNENFLHSARVQVKGMQINSFSKNIAKFSLKIPILEAFKKDGGTIFFLVEILQNDDKKFFYKIFYNILLPYDINKILIKAKNKKTTTIYLTELDPLSLENLFFNYAKNRKKQFSTSETVIDPSVFPKTILQFNTTGTPSHPFFNMFTTPTYIYQSIPGTNLSVPIDKIPPLTSGSLEFLDLPLTISIDDEVFFEKSSLKFTKTSHVYCWGENLKIDTENHTFNFNISGSISAKINLTKFLLKLTQIKHFAINDSIITIDSTELPKQHDLQVNLDFFVNCQKAFSFF